MDKIKVVNLTHKTMPQYPPKCFLNPKNEGYQIKREWLKKRFSEGLKIKQLYSEKERKCIGFIEYVPGEYAWRAVDAKGYTFIHCIWVSPNKYKGKGYGSLLIKECMNDAKKAGNLGVAVITSEGPFMAGKSLFLKNGFECVDMVDPFALLVYPFIKGPLPKFKNWEKQLKTYEGLHIVYSNQCPWVARSIKELTDVAKEKGLTLTITELKTAEKAQNAPSLYATFNVVYNGNLLVDHYISKKRFCNIIDKNV